MIAVFKQRSPGNIAVLFIFGLLVKLPLFLYPKAVIATANDGRLYQWLIGSLPVNNGTAASIISFILLYIQAIMVNYLVSEYRMIARPNYLAGMAYMLITSLLPEWNYLSSPLVANTLIIWMFIYLFSLYNAAHAKGQVYNIGLIAGICSYVYFPSAAFVLCILLGLMILKSFRLNEIALFLVGWLTPYYFHGIYLFLVDRLSISNFFPQVSIRVPPMRPSIWLAASALLLTLPFLLGGYYVQLNLRKMLIQVRKNWSVLVLYLLFAFFIPFINNESSFYTWILIAAPFAAFHACAYFYPPRRWLPLILFFISLGYILYAQYQTNAWH